MRITPTNLYVSIREFLWVRYVSGETLDSGGNFTGSMKIPKVTIQPDGLHYSKGMPRQFCGS